MVELMEDARALLRRQRAAAERISALKDRCAEAVGRINTSLDVIEASGESAMRNIAPEVVEGVVRVRLESLLLQIQQLTVAASAVGLNAATIDASSHEIAESAESIAAVAQQLPDHVPNVIEAAIIQPAIEKLNEAWEELQGDWDEA